MIKNNSAAFVNIPGIKNKTKFLSPRSSCIFARLRLFYKGLYRALEENVFCEQQVFFARI